MFLRNKLLRYFVTISHLMKLACEHVDQSQVKQVNGHMTCNEVQPPPVPSVPNEVQQVSVFQAEGFYWTTAATESDGQSKDDHEAVDGAVLPAKHTAGCRGQR